MKAPNKSTLAIWCLSLVLLIASAYGASEKGNRVLVLVEDLAIKDTHSIFFQDLKDRGFELNFFRHDDSELVLKRHGQWNYEHAVVFAPSIASFTKIEAGQLVDFIDAGGNLLVAGDSVVGAATRLVAREVGVFFDASGSSVIDHANYDVSDAEGAHSLIVSSNLNENATVVYGKSASSYKPILFRGIGHQVDDNNNPLLFKILSASSTAYSANVAEAPKKSQLTRTNLITAVQARNNARVIVTGSLSLFSNQFFTSKAQAIGSSVNSVSGNRALAADLTAWAFQERGVLRISQVRHYLAETGVTPAVYRIKDKVVYAATIQEWNGQQWVPFKKNDVQLEFVLIDPYVRTYLTPNASTGVYSVELTLPDVYGIFTFSLDYERLGYSFLVDKIVVPVRPFRHDEYERFITSANPYYAGAISMVVGLFVFSVVFLFNREPAVVVAKTN